MTVSRRGFSLIEVLLAVFILGMTLAAFFGATSQGLAVAASARHYETARTLMNRLDTVEPLQLEDLEEGEESGRFDGEYRDYSWRRIITEVGKEEDEMFRIETRVEWGSSRDPQFESIETFLHLPTAKREGYVDEGADPF